MQIELNGKMNPAKAMMLHAILSHLAEAAAEQKSESREEEDEVTTTPDPLKGRYVICRCQSAGVHAGILVSQEKDVVLLSQSRRLWNWRAKSGIALSGVAANGLDGGCKIDSVVSLIRLTGVIETIVATDVAKESIKNYA